MKLIKTSIVPILALLILTCLGRYIFMVDGQIDWLRLCLVYGIPFGIPYMLLVIPIGGNPATSVTIMVVNIVIGAVFGCVIAVFAAIRAVIYFLWWLIHQLFLKRGTI